MPADVTTHFRRSFLKSAEPFPGKPVFWDGTQRTPLFRAFAAGRFARSRKGRRHLRTAVNGSP